MTQTPDQQAIARLAEVLADRQRKVEALSGIRNFAFEDAEQLINNTIERCKQAVKDAPVDQVGHISRVHILTALDKLKDAP